MARLLEACEPCSRWPRDIEITLEANPGTIERGRFTDYRAAGINRVSLGAQSFDPQQLQRLGRIHCAADTQRAVEELHAAGLDNFNLDLMYALPSQDLAAALADIEQAVALQPAHISHYQLTLEPGTVFGGRPPAGHARQRACRDMQLACQQRLAAAGYGQYEVSAYARAGAQCRHNLNYWHFGDYLGIGAGAHGKISRSQPTACCIERTVARARAAPLSGERRRGRSAESRACPRAELPFEFLLNALRLHEGFERTEFERRTGLPFALLARTLARAQRRGLMQEPRHALAATALGLNF